MITENYASHVRNRWSYSWWVALKDNLIVG